MKGYNQRQRKKLHLAEFQEKGFKLDFEWAAGQPAEGADAFWNDFFATLVENDLAFGGNTRGYIARGGRGTCTDADRDFVTGWLKARAEIASVTAHSLEDAWYPPEA